MCGIIGIVRRIGTQRSADDRTLARMRDLLAHRGPDGAGLWSSLNAALGHRLLAIRDPGAVEQPFILRDADGRVRQVLTYNGELYNASEIRRELLQRGVVLQSECDTEILAHALDQWDTEALPRLRGMFAFAVLRPQEARLTLVRDPLGIKPLLYAHVPGSEGGEFVFASEPAAILDHPDMPMTPDWGTVSAYLSTIRITLGDRTLFEGIRTLRPGERLDLKLDAPALQPVITRWYVPTSHNTVDPEEIDSVLEQLEHVLTDSVHRHLVSDRPLCALLSGGLDSTIVTMLARDRHPGLETWCSGAAESEDLSMAEFASTHLHTKHSEAILNEDDFAERWPAMIRALRLPLGTPNETAINLVSQVLGASSRVVLSGEGADELFGGYDVPQSAALRYTAHPFTEQGHPHPPENFLIDLLSWIHPANKAVWLREDVRAAAEYDAPLRAEMRTLAEVHGGGLRDMDGFLRAQRAFNLPGLLGRLDTSTMLASVEGRTPFADIAVAEFAAKLPADLLLSSRAETYATGEGDVLTMTAKPLLRSIFTARIPDAVRHRPKVSFPIPFEQWMHRVAPVLDATGPIGEIFTEPGLRMIQADPGRHWRTAWPMLNIACWLRALWG